VTFASPCDRAALVRATALAEQVRATTSPNPAVGCVLLRDGEVVGAGATEPAGGAHAEVVALRAAGPSARGATAVVTLEPCAHHGRTPPCTDALVAAGVARVVIGHADPNPVASGGAHVLAARGLEVVGPGPGDDPIVAAIAEQLEGFLSVVTVGRPHVTLKLAQTADGALVPTDGHRWITGPAARAAVHRWRASVDAVLVGSGTVLTDDPRLDVRMGVADITRAHQPRPVVLDARLRTPADAAVVRRGAVIVTARPGTADAAPPSDGMVDPASLSNVTADAAIVDPAPSGQGVADAASPSDAAASWSRRRESLVAAGAQIVEVAAAPGGGVELGAALRALAALGITSVLAEPGRTLAHALVAADLVDRLVLHIAVDQGAGPPAHAVSPRPGARWWTERSGGAGPDLILHLRPERPVARIAPTSRSASAIGRPTSPATAASAASPTNPAGAASPTNPAGAASSASAANPASLTNLASPTNPTDSADPTKPASARSPASAANPASPTNPAASAAQPSGPTNRPTTPAGHPEEAA
jgi:diaminohydroxyphosphoribosylaminopyrimidine deaminase / 5-amino-6-(5-phosphoribosylamino)uracil reductase